MGRRTGAPVPASMYTHDPRTKVCARDGSIARDRCRYRSGVRRGRRPGGVNYPSLVSSAEKALHSLAGQGHVLAPADVSDPAAVREMVDRVATAMGGIDVR